MRTHLPILIAAFPSFLADETIFFGRKGPIRGKAANPSALLPRGAAATSGPR